MNFKKTWKSSKSPKNQRKYRHNSPLHIKHKIIASHLSKELREKYKKRSLPLRKGDKVKIMRGNFKGKKGTVDRVEIKKQRIYITGIDAIKKDGTKRMQAIRPSNLLITGLNTDDKKRKISLERKNDKK